MTSKLPWIVLAGALVAGCGGDQETPAVAETEQAAAAA